MLKAWVLVLFANFVLVTPATLVPRISNANGFQLKPGNDQYTLSIRHPDGKSSREETVKEIAPGILEVRGALNQHFENQGNLVVIYEAGPNGYVAKYIYKGAGKKEEPMFQFALSATVLKSTAG
ncbi:uncharacterized protein LOC6559681 [Drosophila grimshawi]|uniref:GH20762 n=1 Tax=Drosophila grimshawi TaxID=7222 RepID=B4J6C6_DROGR|nr:uncharacterized protein LOC6559681 [Drosophila grimshawi]EDW00899.1 GH20762 [Drosophila grimshawi]